MAVEKRIIMGKMDKVGKVDEDFADKLVTWADIIRKTFYEGAIEELVSTRRLEHIVNAYAMFNDRVKAITLCINRFDTDTRGAFLELYNKVDGTTGDADLTEEVNVEYTNLVIDEDYS